MKTTGVSIQVPNPCHESWEGMKPEGQGRFCAACSKTVVDFTGKNDAEIRDLLLERAGQKVCGRFKTTQLNRSLQLPAPTPSVYRPSARTFAMALLFVFGTSLVSCYDHQGKKIEPRSLNFFLPVSYKHDVLGEPFGSNTTAENPDSLNRPAPVTAQEVPDPVMSGDVIMVEEIKGKIEYVPEPTDTLTQGERNNCTKPDSTENRGVLMTMGAMVVTNHAQEPPVEEDSLAFQEKNRQESLPSEKETPPVVLYLYPNPSAGEFTMAYTLSESSDVSVCIFDQAGSLVRKLVNISGQHRGQYRIPVNLSDKPAGLYIAVSVVNGKRSSARLVVAR